MSRRLSCALAMRARLEGVSAKLNAARLLAVYLPESLDRRDPTITAPTTGMSRT